MTQRDWFLPLAGETIQAYGGHYMPTIMRRLEEGGLEGSDFNVTQTALAVDPAPLTAEHILKRAPYMSAEQVDRFMATAAEHGLLGATGEGGYVLTDAGRELLDDATATVTDTAMAVAPSLPDDVETLTALLRRQVDGCVARAGIDRPSLEGSRSFDPGPDAPAMERVRRYVNDLYAYRDDAHVAAWRAHGVQGFEWEAFSHVWGENVWGDPIATAAEAAEKLGFRGYDEADYAAALERMTARGWLAEDGGRYAVTAAGRQVREAAEAATDRHFFAPWDLTNDEARQVRDQLTALRDALQVEDEAVD